MEWSEAEQPLVKWGLYQALNMAGGCAAPVQVNAILKCRRAHVG